MENIESNITKAYLNLESFLEYISLKHKTLVKLCLGILICLSFIVVEGYRIDGKIKQKTIKDFGYLEDQTNQEEFIAMVNKFDEDYKKNKLLLLCSNKKLVIKRKLHTCNHHTL